ncbi:MAG: hypothetical protein ACXVZP_00285 [Gaiellaceae bacterium]
MVAEVFPERVIWQRTGAARRFVGTLARTGDRLRLAGHDPYTGAEALLFLPAAELGLSQAASCREELIGEVPTLVLPVSGTAPLLLRPVAPDGPVDLAELQRFLDDAARTSSRSEASLRRALSPLRRQRHPAAEKAAGA